MRKQRRRPGPLWPLIARAAGETTAAARRRRCSVPKTTPSCLFPSSRVLGLLRRRHTAATSCFLSPNSRPCSRGTLRDQVPMRSGPSSAGSSRRLFLCSQPAGAVPRHSKSLYFLLASAAGMLRHKTEFRCQINKRLFSPADRLVATTELASAGLLT